MEKHIQDIERINQYINNALSEEERQAFHLQLTTDNDFKELYEEHLTFLGGLDRIQLKQEIQVARTAYHTSKWIKYIIIILGIIGLSVLVYSLVFTEDTSPLTTLESKEQIIIQKDSSENDKQMTAIEIAQTEDTIVSIISQKTQPDLAYNKSPIDFSSFYSKVKKSPQAFIVNTEKDTVITCKEGTILTIKANSFIDKKTGKTTQGRARLEVTEYYTLSDILMGNLTTMSNDKQLETGGMLFIEAFKSNAPLQLNNDMTIEFPTKNKKPGMQLFTGQETKNDINWIIENSSSVNPLIHDIADVPFAIVEEVPSFPECQGMNNQEKKECVSNVFNRIINRKFNADIFQDFSTNNRFRIFTLFAIDTTGNITNIKTRPSFPGIQEEVERVLALVPKLIPGEQRGQAVNVLYSLPISIQFDDTFDTSDRRVTQLDPIPTSIKFSQGDSTIVTGVNNTIYYDGRISAKKLEETLGELKEVLQNNDITIDQVFLDRFIDYKKRRLIRYQEINGSRYVFIRKAVLENPDSGFTTLATDSITRGGNVIRKRWDSTQVTNKQSIRVISRRPVQFRKPLLRDSTLRRDSTANGNNVITGSLINRQVSRRQNATYYLFKTSRLRWINCDRFIGYKGSKIRYKIKIKDHNNANVKVVFKNTRSILSGFPVDGSFDFGDIPKGEDITLVAIKIIDNQYHLAIKETNTRTTEALELNFKEYSIEDLKKELKKLNNML